MRFSMPADVLCVPVITRPSNKPLSRELPPVGCGRLGEEDAGGREAADPDTPVRRIGCGDGIRMGGGPGIARCSESFGMSIAVMRWPGEAFGIPVGLSRQLGAAD